MKTFHLKEAEIKKDWVIVDAANQPVGRIATEVARILRGKHKPTFSPHLDCGDAVIVVNAAQVRFTGNKWKQKNYYRHTGYMGGLKETSAQEMLEKNPDRIITFAVKGMLPKNKLSSRMMKHLRVYAGEEHGQEAQKPQPAPARLNISK